MKDYAIHSGERVSVVTEDRIITDHLARYMYAADFISKKNELGGSLFGADIFCGVGYGSNILAKIPGSTIFGIDGSEESVIEANLSYPRANLYFSAKLFPLHLPLLTFDFICSFESIEHVLDYKLFATEVAGSLKQGGFLFVSCPSSERINLEENPYHWHFKNLSPVELETLFTELGLTLIERFSTDCVIPNERKEVVACNWFAIPRNYMISE
jgi:2-polyprenyl-3-methyl-5-hydroxy-6-metoxy-1,4-benzoquinol methylase